MIARPNEALSAALGAFGRNRVLGIGLRHLLAAAPANPPTTKKIDTGCMALRQYFPCATQHFPPQRLSQIGRAPHLAENSSKVSSACSPLRRGIEVLKLAERATAERAIKGWRAGRTGAARRTEPRAAMRRREADMIEGRWWSKISWKMALGVFVVAGSFSGSGDDCRAFGQSRVV